MKESLYIYGMKYKNTILIGLFVCLTSLLSGCFESKEKQLLQIENTINNVKKEYAPDKRVALYDISATLHEKTVKLIGETNLVSATDELKSRLEGLGYAVNNEVETLPHAGLEGKIYGIINNSVSNIRSLPKHSAELATQATLGTEVKVLKRKGEWYQIQTPDKYISWVDHGGLVVLDESSYDVWKNAEKLIFLEYTGNVYAAPEEDSEVVGDLVMGSLMKLEGETSGFYEVAYPDGRKGFVEKSKSRKYEDWLSELNRGGGLMTDIAMGLKGSPYLWGGTSPKGMDCSGFTKIIYFMNGLVIPRDASQQVNEGLIVDADLTFEGLEVGDLLFFGRPATDSTRQRTTHVGMWIGDGQFIHASKNVRISSINKNSANYDSMNVNRYLGSKRYLNNFTDGIIDLKEGDLLL